MATALPSGIGNDQQAAQATAFMREQPWYRQLFTSWGVNPDNPGDFHLSDDQQKQLLDTARQRGIGISDKYEVDRNGAIVEGGHKLRNTLIGAGIAGSLLIPGVAPALMHGLSSVGHTIGGVLGVGGGGGGLGNVVNAGSRIASLVNTGKGLVDSFGTQNAAEANQLANNRVIGARVDQGGPGADQQAFRNAMRAGLVARMDPNKAPLVINGHEQTRLVTPENVDYAKTLQGQLAARQAAGKTATTFGVPDPTQQELDAEGRARTLGTTGNVIDAGSKIASLFGLLKNRGDGGTTTAKDVPYDYAGLDKVEW